MITLFLRRFKHVVHTELRHFKIAALADRAKLYLEAFREAPYGWHLQLQSALIPDPMHLPVHFAF